MNTHLARAPETQASLPKDNAVDALYAKVSWRIIPLLIVCYMVAYLDRINIGYAQLQMKQMLPFSDAVYGFGAGIFFIGYFLFEVPSNLLLEKIGARKTLLRIMFAGASSRGEMFVQAPTQFYVLRFLLGVFEAGFFPGIILYLTYWYPSRGAAGRPRSSSAISMPRVAARCQAGSEYLDGATAAWLAVAVPRSRLPASARRRRFFDLQDKPKQARWLRRAKRRRCGPTSRTTRTAWRRRRTERSARCFSDPQGLRAGAGLLPAARRDLHDDLLGADADQELGCRRPDANRPCTRRCLPLGVCRMILSAATPTSAARAAGASPTAWLPQRAASSRRRPISMPSRPFLGRHCGKRVLGSWASMSKVGAAAGIALISSLGNLGAAVSPAVTGAINARTGSPVYSMYW